MLVRMVQSGVGNLNAAMMSGVQKVLTKIPPREKTKKTMKTERSEWKLWDHEPPGNLDTCVISAPATCDSSKIPEHFTFRQALPLNASSVS